MDERARSSAATVARLDSEDRHGPSTVEVPAWLVLGMTVAVAGDPADQSPGLRPETTTLHDEGWVGAAPVRLVEAFSRHFLSWVHRWQEDGLAPVAEAWTACAVGYRDRVDWDLPGLRIAGRPVGLDDRGGLLVEGESGRGQRSIPLERTLSGPTWVL